MYPFVCSAAWDLVTMINYLGVGLYGVLHAFTFIHISQPRSALTLKYRMKYGP